jgi:hypothetical protein
LLVVDPDEYFIEEKSIAVSSVLSFQSSSAYSSEFDTPQPDCFSADSDASFGEQIFDVSMSEVKAEV